MAITKLTADLNIIAALDDEPNDSAGLTPAQAKAKFDEAGNTVKTYLNDSLIPELDAAHIPYLYGGGDTIQGAFADVIAGVVPDESVVTAKLASKAVTTAKLDDGAVTTDKLDDEAVTTAKIDGGAVTAGKLDSSVTDLMRDAVDARSFPHEELTATWDEMVPTSGSVTKTLTHSLGKTPSRVRIFFYRNMLTASVDILYDGTSYTYSMSGVFYSSTNSSFGVWKKETISGGYLIPNSAVFGTPNNSQNEVDQYRLRLSAITFSDTTIILPFSNSWPYGQQALSTSVVAEVYE